MLKPKKSLGQNFLKDQNTIRKIVDGLQAETNEVVFEIGPGEGALTGLLFEKYPQLQVIEIDRRAVALLKEKFPDLVIHQNDIRKTDWSQLIPEGQKVSAIGNLPYYITSVILFSVLDNGSFFNEAVFMMQKEVAERVVAPHGNKTYGILSVQAQLLSNCEILFPVSRHVFHPKPKVESAVVRFRPKPLPADCDLTILKQIVRTCFNQRRKKMSNSLKSLELPTELLSQYADLRPEQLSPDDFLTLAIAVTNSHKTDK